MPQPDALRENEANAAAQRQAQGAGNDANNGKPDGIQDRAQKEQLNSLDILRECQSTATDPGYAPAIFDTATAGLLNLKMMANPSTRLGRMAVGSANGFTAVMAAGIGTAKGISDLSALSSSNTASEFAHYGLATIGDAAMAGGGFAQFIPAARSYSPSLIAGGYGLTRLVMSDFNDLTSSRSAADVSRYGLATVSDLSMVAGAVAPFIPRVRSIAPWLTGLGLIGHAASSYLPDSSIRPQEAAHQLLQHNELRSQRQRVETLLESGQSEIRPYDVYVPKDVPGNRPMPVMFFLHGCAPGNAAGLMEKEAGQTINRLAEQDGFIAVYPVSKDGHRGNYGMNIEDWNSPGAGLSDPVAGYDDVNYLNAIRQQLNNKYNVDKGAVYAVGFSSGGAMAQHWRGREPGVFAGIGSVHGTLLGTEAAPKPGDQTAFISVLGDSDLVLPMTGGRGLLTSYPLTGGYSNRVATSEPLSQAEVARRANLLDGKPVVSTSGNVELTEYIGERGQAPVRQYVVRGGTTGGVFGNLFGAGRDGAPSQHAWDGGDGGMWPVGMPSPQLDVSQLMIRQLLQHRRADGGVSK